jgi:hypothetical protein
LSVSSGVFVRRHSENGPISLIMSIGTGKQH